LQIELEAKPDIFGTQRVAFFPVAFLSAYREKSLAVAACNLLLANYRVPSVLMSAQVRCFYDSIATRTLG
jgi:hypothetical protein